ncbi:MAG TPA: TerC family protein [Ramlibacter sp.]|jgi:YjbE family integral membrane protein|uniref:TerC family protein n=1 Tax=Ramlibacter sp. TaxID=1917967 RepID=UPI002D2A0C92|nr:TerC family protein [Ramlibacter sp.]HZY18729.1 TerC family protein [Ramlibacter sp.]
MDFLSTSTFWIALLQIIMINIVLSGDNAVVIALACRSLPPQQQKKAIMFGSVGAIVLRLVLTFFAVYLLTLPYLKLIGAALLLWIGIGLLKGEDDEEELQGHSSLAAAIKTIVIADLVMSLDNVIGVAAAAKGDIVLLVVGLVISIPLIIFGSTIILKLMSRFPIIITIGAGLLGWVAGEMALSDPSIKAWAAEQHVLHWAAPIAGALIVIALGKWLAAKAAGAGDATAAKAHS